MIAAVCACMYTLMDSNVTCVFKVYLFYLTEVVVDIKVFASQHQELDQFVDNGHLPLHHCYMKSSVTNTKKKKKTHKEFYS